jgi:ketosteroid isomerase-like protein
LNRHPVAPTIALFDILAIFPKQRTRARSIDATTERLKSIKETVMTATALRTATQSDHDILVTLNRDYIDAVQRSDVQRFDEILSDDFYCSNSDGSLVDRAAFLKQTARPVAISNLRAEDVMIRVMDDFAIIHARTVFTKPDGSAGGGRYTDVWAKRGGRWLAVSAHVTRL